MCFVIVSFWHIRELKLTVGHREIYYAKKILNYFGFGELRIIVEK